jgi:hypothetical protein
MTCSPLRPPPDCPLQSTGRHSNLSEPEGRLRSPPVRLRADFLFRTPFPRDRVSVRTGGVSVRRAGVRVRAEDVRVRRGDAPVRTSRDAVHGAADRVRIARVRVRIGRRSHRFSATRFALTATRFSADAIAFFLSVSASPQQRSRRPRRRRGSARLRPRPPRRRPGTHHRTSRRAEPASRSLHRSPGSDRLPSRTRGRRRVHGAGHRVPLGGVRRRVRKNEREEFGTFLASPPFRPTVRRGLG